MLKNIIASRFPIQQPSEEDLLAEEEVEDFVVSHITQITKEWPETHESPDFTLRH